MIKFELFEDCNNYGKHRERDLSYPSQIAARLLRRDYHLRICITVLMRHCLCLKFIMSWSYRCFFRTWLLRARMFGLLEVTTFVNLILFLSDWSESCVSDSTLASWRAITRASLVHLGFLFCLPSAHMSVIIHIRLHPGPLSDMLMIGRGNYFLYTGRHRYIVINILATLPRRYVVERTRFLRLLNTTSLLMV